MSALPISFFEDWREMFKDLPDLMTAKELASVIRLNVKTIYSLVARGMIPYVRIGSALLFSKAQIIAWLEERNFRPRPNGGGRN